MTQRSFIGGAAVAAIILCGNLLGGQVTLTGLPQYNDPINGPTDRTDTLTVNLDSLGIIHGLPGDTVGWGFSIDWDSNAGDYVKFNSSSLTGSLSSLSTGGYTDLIGTGTYGNGPVNFSVPANSNWSQPFLDTTFGPGVSPLDTYEGAGGLSIDAGATPGAEYIGQMLMTFSIFDGDPGAGGTSMGSRNIALDVTVGVDTPPVTDPNAGGGGDAPEPGTLALTFGAGVLAYIVKRRATPSPLTRPTQLT